MVGYPRCRNWQDDVRAQVAPGQVRRVALGEDADRVAVHHDREHFIPLIVADLIEFLAAGRGAKVEAQTLPTAEQASFRELAKALQVHFHRAFYERMHELKTAYTHFDPDTDTPALTTLDEAEKSTALENLYAQAKNLLEKANFKEISRIEAMNIIQGSSLWGLEMEVSWDIFDHLSIFYRGDVNSTRTVRRWWKLWWKEEKVVAAFNRLVLIVRQRPHKRLGKYADTNSVYLKMFKDMPKPDLEMVLPGTRLKLTNLDKGMIFYPIISGLALVMYKVLADVIGFKDIFAIGASVSLSWSLAAAFAGYSYKSYVSYTTKKTSYTLQLTQSLYYQNIDSNAGVFHRVLSEAEDQETREALLGYFYLWKRANGRPMTAADLDNLIEEDLDKRLGLKVDFEIADALGKLEHLKLVTKVGDGYLAVPLAEALQALAEAKPQENKPATTTEDGWALPDLFAPGK